MKSLIWTATVAALLVGGLALTPAAAQNPAPPKTNPNVPSFVTNPWGNPIFSIYQRQRELREQAQLQQSIQQLQKLEVLKAANRTATQPPAEPRTSASQEAPKTSTTFINKLPPKKGTAAKPMKKAADGGAAPEPEATATAPKGPQKSSTFSNYDKILGRKPQDR